LLLTQNTSSAPLSRVRHDLHSFPTRRSSDLRHPTYAAHMRALHAGVYDMVGAAVDAGVAVYAGSDAGGMVEHGRLVDEIEALHRSEEHTYELQSRENLVCRLLLQKKQTHRHV